MIETTAQIFVDMRLRTLEAVNSWLVKAEALSLAYEAAYLRQEKVLNVARKAVEATRKKQQEMMSVALNTLSAGIIGPFVNDLLQKAPVKLGVQEGVEALKQAVQGAKEDPVLVGWTKDALNHLASTGKEFRQFAMEKLAPTGAGAGFSPASVTPGTYGGMLREGIYNRATYLSAMAGGMYDAFVKDKTTELVAPEIASKIRASFLASDFFKMPRNKIEPAVLKDRASVALWIGWARARDRSYWVKEMRGAVDPLFHSEAWDFAALHSELQSLGIPVHTMEARRFAFYHNQSQQKTMDMPKFIDWSKGQAAAGQMYVGLPLNSEGVKKGLKDFETRIQA